MKYQPLDKSLFVDNRARFKEMLPAGSMAVFFSNDEMPRSGDQSFLFRQNPDIYYLSGLDQEKIILVIYPDCPNPLYREALFIRRTNEHIAVWEGHKYTQEEAREASGIQQIYWEDDFESALPSLMAYCDRVYVNINENDRAVPSVHYKDIRFAHQVRADFPAHELKRSGPIMQQLRAIKSPIEIQATRKACEITRDAFVRVMKFMKPGVGEYEVEAEIIHEFIRQRATGHAYSPIIAAGKNACVLHYVDNNAIIQDGDLVLMDFGAEYANYAADLSRTIPASGRFSPRQKAVYDACRRVQKEAITMLRPGLTLVEYNKEVGKVMEAELIQLGLLDKAAVAQKNPDLPLYKKYFMHGTAHFLGIDVHDVGPRYEPMRVGNLFTCEPGIYIPEENIGIRIENNILITEDGFIDLMADIPADSEEIEEIMNS
jgi:Xaa-Pro aminopeptidase